MLAPASAPEGTQAGAAQGQQPGPSGHAAPAGDPEGEVSEATMRLHMAAQAKDKGADLYKKQQYSAARDAWLQALEELSAPVLAQDADAKRMRVSLYLNLAQAALQLKEYEDAVAQCSLALKLEPENSKAFFRRGLANDGMGKVQSAAADLLNAARIEPKNAEIRRKYEELKKKKEEADANKEDEDTPPVHNLMALPRVFMDVAIGSRPPKRLVFALYTDTVPKTAENFRQLCTGEHKGTTARGKPFHYKGSILHRMIPGLMVQGGDFDNVNGTGGESIYGRRFPDEGFRDKHTRRGLLAMANDGPNTNGSNFFVTFAEAEHLDRRHVIFGEVVSGADLLDELEGLPTNPECRPLTDCVVVDCGECGPGGTVAGDPGPG